MYDQVNNTYDKYQEESILSTSAIPSSTHEKWRKMNANWSSISRYADQPRMIVEQPIAVSGVQVVCTTPDILVTQADDGRSEFLLFIVYVEDPNVILSILTGCLRTVAKPDRHLVIQMQIFLCL